MTIGPANDTRRGGAEAYEFYIDAIMSVPILSAEEERRLCRLWLDHRDRSARGRVVAAHMRIAVKQARRLSGYGLSMEDLIGEGALGLDRAMEKFDPDLGYRFVTYASWWVRAAMIRYVLQCSRQTPMGTTKDSKKLFFGMKRAKARLGILEDAAMTPLQIEAVATETGTAIASVVEMERRMMADSRLNAIDVVSGREAIELLVNDAPLQDEVLQESQDNAIRQTFLSRALDELNARDRHVVEARRLSDEPMTLEQLSQIYGVSRERIRQIEVRVLERLEKRVLQMARTARRLPIAA